MIRPDQLLTGKQISERISILKKIIASKEKALLSAPEGWLKIQVRGDKSYYYVGSRDTPGRKYLKKDQIAIARKLAQKSYDRSILESARNELNALEMLLKKYPDVHAEDIFDLLSDARKTLVTPITSPKEIIIKKWLEKPYMPKPFSDGYPELYTENGDRVRSKSEILIANLLYKKGYPYKYECPYKLSDGKVIYPDFTIFDVTGNREIYLEHLGMMDDSTYSENAAGRISLYEKDGIYPGDRLILTYETRRHPLNIKDVEKKLEYYLR